MNEIKLTINLSEQATKINISYVDLDYIYSEDYKNHIPCSQITEKEYREIMKLIKF